MDKISLLILLLLSVANICLKLIECKVEEPPPDWWENASFYQVYPRSFMDSNGDGIGDLLGITKKLDYLKSLGITGILLAPIFSSAMFDTGHDITSYTTIHEEYGTMEEFDELLKRANKLGLRLILDVVPNHSSHLHDWFVKSVERASEYENYYVWHPGKVNESIGEHSPPSNWLSTFRRGAWSWHKERKEYYYHQFSSKQPDLNYREPKVRKRMEEVFEFWLSKGISGFLISDARHLFERAPDGSGYLPDEPRSYECDDPKDSCYLNHVHTQHLDETFELIYSWQGVLDSYTAKHGGPTRVMMVDAWGDAATVLRYYGNGTRRGVRMPLNFSLLQGVENSTDAFELKRMIDAWMEAVPAGERATWIVSADEIPVQNSP